MNTPSGQPDGGGVGPLALQSGTAWLPALVALLDEQQGLCSKLSELSTAQGHCVDSGDTDGLLAILGQRHGIVERIAAINLELGPFRERRTELLARLSPADRAGVQDRIARIAALVDAVRTRDDADRAALEHRRGEVAGELADMTRSRGALAAYGARPAQGPKMQDRLG